MTRTLCFLVDLASGDAGPAYDNAHRHELPAEVSAGMRACGIIESRIYRLRDRLVMILHVDEGFSMQRAAELNAGVPEIQAWNRRMAALQRAPFSDATSWMQAECVFEMPHATEI